MDFQVKATVHLSVFQDEGEVLEALRSHGLEVSHLGPSEVRVCGSYLKLRAVKAQLERLPRAQAHPAVSSGAIPKTSSSHRGRSGSRNKPPVSPSHSHPTPLVGAGEESVVVDRDVFLYAERLRESDVSHVLRSHGVDMAVEAAGDTASITLKGRGAGAAAAELQGFLSDLTASLRTQEVLLQDVDRRCEALLRRIQRDRNVCGSVLVCEMDERLHLVGPSADSYELKQKLLGRRADREAERGAPRRRSRSSGRKWSKRPGGDLQETGKKRQTSLFHGCSVL